MPKLQLHTFGGASSVSANSIGCLILVAANKLTDVETVNQYGKTRTPEFEKINPFHGCPALTDGDFNLWESNTVLRYLATKFKLDAWYPADLKKRAKVDSMLDYRQASLYKHIADMTYPSLFGIGDATKVADGQKGVEDCLEEMKHFLTAGKFLGGFETPTLADLSVAPLLIFCTVIKGFAFPKHIDEYLARMEAGCPEYKEQMAALKGYIASKNSPAPAPESEEKAIFGPDESAGADKFKTFDDDFCLQNGGWTVPDLKTLDFASIHASLQKYEKPVTGKPYLALMWAQYHKPGYKFIALYSQLAARFRGKLTIVGISMDPEGPSVVNKYIEDPGKKYSKEFPLEFQVAMDAGNVFKKSFADSLRGTLSPPHAYLVDAKGKVVWHQDHSELGATMPSYMQLMEKQVAQFLKDGTVAKVGNRPVVEVEEEEEEEGGQITGDVDLF